MITAKNNDGVNGTTKDAGKVTIFELLSRKTRKTLVNGSCSVTPSTACPPRTKVRQVRRPLSHDGSIVALGAPSAAGDRSGPVLSVLPRLWRLDQTGTDPSKGRKTPTTSSAGPYGPSHCRRTDRYWPWERGATRTIMVPTVGAVTSESTSMLQRSTKATATSSR